jgi:murein DD-endopeptidase MepM/ murein hydrolase activator NlpD
MGFVPAALAISATFIAAIFPPVELGSDRAEPAELYPAPPGYLLPWAGGEIQAVTQGEETTFTHNGIAAYAFDFGMSYDVIVASRSGKVSMVRDDSNIGGCNAIYASASNYVVIDHGDGTSALYLHLAHRSALVRTGDLVEQGQPIAVSGETGVTCNASMTGPGPHLHFQVQRNVEHRYFTQSIPIAFDDIRSNNGVPQHGRSYVSGNFGRGQEQRIPLTPHRVPRVFNPVAVPANPELMAADPAPVPTPTPEDAATGPEDGAAAEPPQSGTQGSAAEPAATPPPAWTPVTEPSVTPTHTRTSTAIPTPKPPPTSTPPPSPAAPDPTPGETAATQSTLPPEEDETATP